MHKTLDLHFSDPFTKEAVEEAGGGHAYNGAVGFSPEQLGALANVYGFDLARDQDSPGAALMLAGNVRNLMRHAEVDALRLIAMIAHAVKPGQDPVKVLVALLERAGANLNEDLAEWAHEDCPYGRGV